MISLERQENIAVERDTLPESYRTVLRRSSSVVVFSWRTKCAGRAGLVTYSTAFQLSASPRLPRQHGPLSRRILSPKVHSYPVCIQASHQNTGLGLWDMFVEYHLWNPRVRCENFCDKNCIAELRKVATLAHAINDNCICSGEMGILLVANVLEKTIFGPFAFRIPQVF